jgi:hypothetical protein
MTLRTRIDRLEADFGADGEVGLEELVRYSMATVRDLAFEARLARSTLGRLIAETVHNARARAAIAGAA